MSITTTQQVLSGLVLFNPAIEIWSGTVKVRRNEDLESAKAYLPPSSLVSDGRKRLIATDPLRPMQAVRKAVERLLKQHGIPLMGGYAIPEDIAEDVMKELPKLRKTFEDAVDQLALNLTDWYDRFEQLPEHAEWSELLNRARLTETDVRSRCGFHVAVYQVASPDPATSPLASKSFGDISASAFPKLLEDIADQATLIYEEAFAKASRVQQRSVDRVRKVVDKLETFSFLDPRVGPMADGLQQQIRNLPHQGALTAAETASVVGLLSVLMNPALLLKQGSITPSDQEFASTSPVDEVLEDMDAQVPLLLDLSIVPVESLEEFTPPPASVPATPLESFAMNF